MNWMTSAKKRVYKTKKQKDQQKRITAQYKISSKYPTVQELQSTSIYRSKNQHEVESRKLTIDAVNLRNLHREKHPASRSTHFDQHSHKPLIKQNQPNYDPMEELLSSPLQSVNELESDVNRAIRSFDVKKGSIDQERDMSECSLSNLSSQSILYIDNGKVLNDSTQPFYRLPPRVFQLDEEWKLPSSELRPHESLSSDPVREEIKPVSLTKEGFKNFEDISRSWDLFEGQAMIPMDHHQYQTSSSAQLPTRGDQRKIYSPNSSVVEEEDVEEFNLHDFLSD